MWRGGANVTDADGEGESTDAEVHPPEGADGAADDDDDVIAADDDDDDAIAEEVIAASEEEETPMHQAGPEEEDGADEWEFASRSEDGVDSPAVNCAGCSSRATAHRRWSG